MHPAYIYGLRRRHVAILAACLLLAGCGQTGPLYLVAPHTTAPQATTRAAPTLVTNTPAPAAATHGHP